MPILSVNNITSNHEVEETKMDMANNSGLNTRYHQYESPLDLSPSLSLLAERKERKELADFFKFMTLCHAVMVDKDPATGEILYQSSSPDETALVEGAKEVGIVLKSRTKETMTIEIDGNEEVYDLCIEFPFDSIRRRMSVVIHKNGIYYTI